MAVDVEEILRRHDTDKESSVHTYGRLYRRIASDIQPQLLVEIGVASGGSLRAWREIFPSCFLVGVDRRVPERIPDRCRVFCMQAPRLLPLISEMKRGELEHFGCADIIIDDASHRIEDQISTMFALWSILNPVGGVYVIEDIQSREDADLLESMFYESRNGGILRGCKGQIIDMRHLNGRYDNIALVVTKGGRDV